MLELPHTPGCLVCGKANPHGLKLHLHVDESTGVVRVDFRPRPEHIGFDGVVHGGVIATVFDEAMVWAATWAGRRFCVCGELTTRFRRPARVNEVLHFEAKVEFSRPRLVTTAATARDAEGQIIATASGKYVPMSIDQHRSMCATFVPEPQTQAAAARLVEAAG
jgi:acyl-coenzyme A thioesterase PaaI-like protein